MIIDFQSDSGNAGDYYVVDADTGKPIEAPVFYADDSTGICKAYIRKGKVLVQDEETGEPLVTVFQRPIRIVKREFPGKPC